MYVLDICWYVWVCCAVLYKWVCVVMCVCVGYVLCMCWYVCACVGYVVLCCVVLCSVCVGMCGVLAVFRKHCVWMQPIGVTI